MSQRKVKQISQLEHAKRKSMWVGSKKNQTIELYCLSDDLKSIVLRKIKYTPAWYKILDEVIVNAIDQWVNYPKKVNEIRIKFDLKTGAITVRNSGPSIGVYKTTSLAGVEMYAVQMIASEFLSGDNLDDDNDERITGGTNGAGLKLTNAFSDWLVVTTVDIKRKKHYSQTFKNRLLEIEEPIIRKLKSDEKTSFTEIEFLPSYKVFGYTKYTQSIGEQLQNLVIMRAYQARAFTTADVYYNDKLIKLPTLYKSVFKNFASMYPAEKIWHTFIAPDSKKLAWEICVGVSDGKFRHTSLINGINVYNGGSHIKHIQNLIVDGLKTRTTKLLNKAKIKFNQNFIINALFIFVKCSVVTPEFTSQIKDALDDPIEKFQKYKFTKRDLDSLWKLLEEHIMDNVMSKFRDKKKSRVVRGAINVPKCNDAKFAGTKAKSSKCTLIICEGDSAMGTVHEGITHTKTNLSYNYYGTFSIQGVPMNARKEVTIYEDKKTNESIILRNAKLQKNERFASLVKVLGLDFEKSYEMNENGDAEFKTLRYGKITAAVDQDDDGKGNIFGLLMNFFILFWPALAKRYYITRFNTPIVRAYPKNKKKYVEEFCSLMTYQTWIKSNYSTEDQALRDYAIKYYKGLGSHKKSEIPSMFTDFEKHLCIYRLDEDAQSKLEVYFGVSSAPRKKTLATPVSVDEIVDKFINISDMLDRDLKAYQRDNITRKLPHVMDGSVPSRRKVIFTARNVFSTRNTEMKVNAFVNETSKTTHYHHGETSLAGTVTKMAQEFPGARHLPFLRPDGQFGTRSMGGKNAANPRYTFTHLNMRLCYGMFPKEDDFLLEYAFDDGVRCEPKYYIPIVPLSILEHMELPATGWKIKIWARDWDDVVKNTKNMILGEIKKAKPMKIWLKDNIGEIRTHVGKQYSVGKYVYDKVKNTINITELPLGKYSSSFIGDYSSGNDKQLCNKPYFRCKPDDNTNDDGVDITFYLTETGWDEINEKYGNETFDCVEDLMNLRTSLEHNLNMIGADGSVLEFKKYESIMNTWFPARKKLYGQRIDRSIILTKLMIQYLENIIRFTHSHQKYNITPKTKIDKVNQILSENNYDTFNSSMLTNPKYVEVEQLESLIINNEDCTSYDYLIKLSYKDMIESACKKRDKTLAEYKQKLKDLLTDNGDSDIFKGGNTWLKELDELDKTVKEGMEKGWSYGKDVAKFR